METVYQIKGMHCGGCEAKINKALAELDGVETVTASAAKDEVRVTHAGDLDEAALRRAVGAAGDYQLGERKPTPSGPDAEATPQPDEKKPESLYPLVLIVGFITGTVALIGYAQGSFEIETLMRHFMAGFFIVFSFFKLLDPPGFVSAYRGYDLLARRSKAWAWAYPYIELGLGIAYLLSLAPLVVNGITLVLMLVGAAGVLKALVDKRAIRCACLGTALNLPMTKVTLVEDLTMAVMAAAMLAMHAR